MSWKEIALTVPDELKDAVIGELSELGVAGVWEDGEPSPGESRLVGYFEDGADFALVESRVFDLFGRANISPPTISTGSVVDQDWTEEWKKSYTSFPIGNNFFVIPSWSDSVCPDDRIPIHIDPGQAFGTGTHETTQLTVEALERWVERRHLVLDLGTGSGILALASRLLGAREVFACDNDPVAAIVAGANIERNAEHEVWTFCGSIDAVSSQSVDLLLCNLTCDLIIGLFPEIDRAIRPGGLAIFSGILNEQREAIQETIDRFQYSVHEQMTRGEWLALVTQKHVA